MFRKFFYIISVIFLLNHCGFTPIYQNNENLNFSINSISYKGDKLINNYFKIYFSNYVNDSNEKKYELKINTDYKKVGISKDKKAKITNYKLTATSLVEVSLNGIVVKNLKISESKNMNDIDDNFEENTNENNIKQNFASVIYRKIITELSILNDS